MAERSLWGTVSSPPWEELAQLQQDAGPHFSSKPLHAHWVRFPHPLKENIRSKKANGPTSSGEEREPGCRVTNVRVRTYTAGAG